MHTAKNTPSKSVEIQTQVSSKFQSGEVKKKTLKMDPLFLQRKQTFFIATKDQNLYQLFSMIRKGQKIEEPKIARYKSKMFEKIENTRKNQFKKFLSST